ncbi:MAG: nicotinate (nicotinamide) nucleotide adenylyltransferase [Desulfovibrio sp.]|jgi:nicotinate-nucleotide adenylyltransferase|nr:nicotinate (nicotinamide) nucleotide adenylyltransferase [Desulfovibrio sp.]
MELQGILKAMPDGKSAEPGDPRRTGQENFPLPGGCPLSFGPPANGPEGDKSGSGRDRDKNTSTRGRGYAKTGQVVANPLFLFGGSFDPPHTGHLRAALECAEILRPSACLFIPCASPPHKTGRRLLPFTLRVDMLRAALADLAEPLPCPFSVCEVENERPGPSYTIDTLKLLTVRFPDKRLTFALGCDDFRQLASWRQGREIPDVADIAVLPRSGYGLGDFAAALAQLRPDATLLPPGRESPPEIESACVLPLGGKIMYISIPTLDLSSSLTRARFLRGRDISFLVPPGVLALLRGNAPYVKKIWEE